MNRFELEESTTVTLANVNFRAERHGEDLTPAVDLKLSLKAGNEVLSHFSGHLKSALYFKKAPEPDDQASLEGVAPVSDLPNLRFPFMAPIKWDAEYTGYALSIDYGLGGKSAIDLADCKVGAFVIAPMEGGTVEVAWRVQASKLSEKVLGKLAGLIGHDIDVTLTGPDAGDEPKREKTLDERQAAGEPAWPFPGHEKAAEAEAPPQRVTLDATDAFVAAQQPPSAKKKAPIKYRDAATGETWSGRGVTPKWLKAAIDRGMSLRDLEV